MAALISQKTNLKSLRYGQDRVGGGSSNQPYIKSPIPDNSSSLGRTGGVDFLLRGGTLTPSRAVEDVSRLTKMFFDFKSPNGVLFTAKQNLLSRTGVKTQASGILNQGAYLPTSTILQVAGNAFGTHLLKQGINPFRDTSPKDDNKVKEMPHIIRVTGFSFTPIQQFVPKLQKNTYEGFYGDTNGGIDKAISGFGKERFIALSKDTSPEADTTNYNQPNDYTFGGPNTSARRQASQDLVQADILKKISNRDRTPSFSIGSNAPQSPILSSRS